MYIINYGFGVAYLWTPDQDWESRFVELAGQCFGIRKSITQIKLIDKKSAEPRDLMDGEYERLETSWGDTIIWDKDGNKIKSEWDY